MNDIDFFSFKDLENVYLKLTYPIEVNGRSFQENETIAYFDKIQLASIHEDKDHVVARGGFDNRGHVFWDTTKDMRFHFTQGVFSSIYFGLMSNSNVIEKDSNEYIWKTKMEKYETDENGRFILNETDIQNLFIYQEDTAEKLKYTRVTENMYSILEKVYTNIICIYEYKCFSGVSVVKIGQRFLNGFLSVEGTTRVKDDVTGLVRTGIIKIPKLKLVSDLSIRLGVQAGPVVAAFEGIGVPVESRSGSYVCEFYFLDEELDD